MFGLSTTSALITVGYFTLMTPILSCTARGDDCFVPERGGVRKRLYYSVSRTLYFIVFNFLL